MNPAPRRAGNQGDLQTVDLTDRRALARKVIEVLELTHLADGCREEDVRALCARAVTPHGAVAAVCVPSKFAWAAREELKGTKVAVCTVANWPRGRSKVDYVAAEAEIAFYEGADEVNVVAPWRSLRAGDPRTPQKLIEESAHKAGRRQFIKATLETGELEEEFLVREAAKMCMDCGAEFLETATGKTENRPTLEQARMILEEIRDHRRGGGFKAGDVKTLDECRAYLELAAEIMGEDWIDPDNIRLGGEAILDEALAVLDEEEKAQA